MLSPKKVQWRKVQKGRMRGKAYRGSDVSFGEYGLMATEPARITARQIEAARIAMTRYAKRGGNIWIRLYEMDGVSEEVAREAFRLASNKLPLKTKFICREQI